MEVTLTDQSPITDTGGLREGTTRWVTCQFWEIKISTEDTETIPYSPLQLNTDG